MTLAARPDPEPAAGAPQPPVPPPPKNYASWLDKIVSRDWNGHDCVAAAHARAELAAIRADLESQRNLVAVLTGQLQERAGAATSCAAVETCPGTSEAQP